MQQIVRIPFGSDPAIVAEILRRDGGLVLTGAVTSDEVKAINSELDSVGLKTADYDLKDVFDETDWGGKTARRVHALKYSKTLREAFCDKEIVADYLAATLPGPKGYYSMISSQAIEVRPGESVQELHRDADVLYARTLGLNNASAVNVGVNFLLALTEVTEEMGATRVIVGSQDWPDYETPGTQEQTIPATMNAGDVLCISGKVLHGGGANTSNRPRRLLSTGFGPAFLLGEEAWPHVISVDEARGYSPRIQGYLGFRSISCGGEEPGFLWRAHGRSLHEHLNL
jgi:ectoine hydroxylase-related dioxygenase (phytanoyl-CoA dioxygenase family)